MDVPLGGDALSFDWFILALRLIFIFLIYFFLFQVARVTVRELIAISQVSARPAAPTVPQPGSRLEVMDPAQSSLATGVTLAVGHHETIGRQQDNSIVLDDAYVSSQHAALSFERGVWTLRDLGSRNGSFINGHPVEGAARLSPGDSVQFGRMQLRFLE
ncbi:MAG: FHA domain-containing protein [Chloroflexia bacterium]|nr:FHA domain-containing protein [Chloroflexia bacterium]MBA3643400.1 FHA domain-containing protein [Chloroflexia bacterium]